ncbi:unnamed protein product [Rangifer tarandus platyrhynchus]|uniref:Uncharacterized protein n=1 Tax=Rangifer tarandus platyrhynchus TaxID=3082113 RepID=A0AC59ZYX6_RANTA
MVVCPEEMKCSPRKFEPSCIRLEGEALSCVGAAEPRARHDLPRATATCQALCLPHACDPVVPPNLLEEPSCEPQPLKPSRPEAWAAQQAELPVRSPSRAAGEQPRRRPLEGACSRQQRPGAAINTYKL